jgi:hypothetical protein
MHRILVSASLKPLPRHGRQDLALCSRYADWEGEQRLAEASQSYSFVPLNTYAPDPHLVRLSMGVAERDLCQRRRASPCDEGHSPRPTLDPSERAHSPTHDNWRRCP